MKKTNLTAKIVAILLVLSLLSGMTVFATAASAEHNPTLKIHAQTLELESNVYINYYVEANGIFDLNSVELQIWTDATGNNNVTPLNHETPTATLTPINTSASLCETDGNTYIKFSFRELAAKQMTDTVYARAHVEIENNHYYSDVQKYSILQYAYNKLGLTDAQATEDESLKELLNSLLAYGSLAQTHFGYATDKLATDTYYQLKTVSNVLADGCNNGLYKSGTELTMTTSIPDETDTQFVGWLQSSTNEIVSNNLTATVMSGANNETYTAIWASKTTQTVSSGEVSLNQNIVVSDDATDAIAVTGGTVTINGGYYNGGQTELGGSGNTAVWANGGDVVINDGYFTINGLADGDTGHIDLIYAKTGTITINGGFFVGEDDTVWLLNCKDANYNNGTANIIVYGGTFVNFDPSNHSYETTTRNFVADGYTVIKEIRNNGDIWYTVVAQDAVNTVINVDGGEITIHQNVVVSGNDTDAITVTGGTVTINGGYYNGGQTELGGSGNTAVWANGGDVVINDGYFTINGLADGDTGHIDLIYAKTGTITINGGFFVSKDNTVWLLNCNDANYKNGTAKIIVTGGTFVNFDPSNNTCEGYSTNFVADGYTVITEVQDNGDIWYTVVPE